MAIKLDEYANKYKHAMLERRDGILQVTLHTHGKELEWGGGPHEELSYLFADIARDLENKVVILTGTGKSYRANPPLRGSANLKSSAWDRVYHEGKHLLMNHPNRKVLCRLLDSGVVSGSAAARSLEYFPGPRPALFPRSLPALRSQLSGSVRLLP